jgi:hypothetical protein
MPAEDLSTDATKTDSGTRPHRGAVALLAIGAPFAAVAPAAAHGGAADQAPNGRGGAQAGGHAAAAAPSAQAPTTPTPTQPAAANAGGRARAHAIANARGAAQGGVAVALGGHKGVGAEAASPTPAPEVGVDSERPAETGGGGGSTGQPGGASDTSPPAALNRSAGGPSQRQLAFTGADLPLIALLGAAALGAGTLLRRRSGLLVR